MSLFDTSLMTPSEKTRLEKELNKVMRFSQGVMSVREWLIRNEHTLYKKLGDQNYKFNRRKFNSMNYEQQKAYEARLNKPSYDVYYGDDFCVAMPRIVWQALEVPTRIKL